MSVILKLIALLGLVGFFVTLVVWLQRESLRGRSNERLGTNSKGVQRANSNRNARSPLSRPFRILPWIIGALIGVGLWLVFGVRYPFAIASAVVISMVANQIEHFLAARKTVLMERQLADAIDIMVGAVGAGAGVSSAIEAAILETRAPLKLELEEVSGRIRLGDNPSEVFYSLAQRVPLETFLLFASTMAVHWEVGGQLAPTLVTISRTVRDRIETQRRIRSNTSQSQMSTIAIVGMTYLIAFVVWRNSPGQMEEYISTSIGSMLVAGSIVMQAIGILWMNAISKVKF